ncbi:MAG: TMEM175 family protein [Bacteroidia bacterium]
MTKTRLEAFSDGVIAIIITIMVLGLKVPESTKWEAIRPLGPVLLGYLVSFIMVAIYWGNHHHLIQTVKEVNSKIIWANFHLLFWLSLVPVATAWMGETNFDKITVAAYAVLLDFCGIAYSILLSIIMKSHSHDPELTGPLQKQKKKGLISAGLYTLAIPMAFVHPVISGLLYFSVAILWWMPDRNIEKKLKNNS